MSMNPPYRTCTVNFDELEHAIVDLNFAVLNLLDNVPDGPEKISLILAMNELAEVHEAARFAEKDWVYPKTWNKASLPALLPQKHSLAKAF